MMRIRTGMGAARAAAGKAEQYHTVLTTPGGGPGSLVFFDDPSLAWLAAPGSRMTIPLPKILHVVGARPNYMKIAPVMKAIARAGFAEQKLVHTGQHYDISMSDVYFTDLGMPRPDIHLGVGSGSHAEQTAKVLVGFEKVCLEEKPDLVVVAGDVNSTLACAIDAAKALVPCAHVEAGLRSFDLRMPEEVNRIVTDRLCEILLTPSADADQNLRAEGTPEERIFRVGNVMIDTLLEQLPRARATGSAQRLGVVPGRYAVLTLHRP